MDTMTLQGFKWISFACGQVVRAVVCVVVIACNNILSENYGKKHLHLSGNHNPLQKCGFFKNDPYTAVT